MRPSQAGQTPDGSEVSPLPRCLAIARSAEGTSAAVGHVFACIDEKVGLQRNDDEYVQERSFVCL